MKRNKNIFKQLFDWMGVVLVIAIAALAISSGNNNTVVDVMSENSYTPVITDGTNAKLIIVDAGHGGQDGGAVSPNGVAEAGLNLKIAKLVESGLREAGFAVEMTRQNENALDKSKAKDMQARRLIMRSEAAVAVVSIHMNKFRDASVNGPMAFYMKGSAQGQSLATTMIKSVCTSIGRPLREANPGDYFVLRESIAPAVIIECGFLSNAKDEALLQDDAHQAKLAAGIVAGVAEYFADK